MRWRSISQDGIRELWMEFCGNMEEDVPETNEVEEAKLDAFTKTR